MKGGQLRPDGLDGVLLLNGPVHQFSDPDLLRSALESLGELGYSRFTVDSSTCQSETDMYRELGRELSFPDYFGNNLNALNDVMDEVASRERAVPRSARGTVLVLWGFEPFAQRMPDEAHALLDIFAVAARRGLLFNHPMLCLIEAPEERSWEPVGGTPVMHQDRLP